MFNSVAIISTIVVVARIWPTIFSREILVHIFFLFARKYNINYLRFQCNKYIMKRLISTVLIINTADTSIAIFCYAVLFKR